MNAPRRAPERQTAQRYSTPAEIEAARALRDVRAQVSRIRIGSIVQILAVAFALALTLRSLVFQPFTVTSPSMQPSLLIGDYLFVAKWPYGYSRYSLPLALPTFNGRWPDGHAATRGDVVVFKSPADNRSNFIKRVIGLPGDRVALIDGALFLNGVAVARTPVATPPGEGPQRRYSETLGSRKYTVTYLPHGSPLDNFGPATVPAGHYFMLGDNRDDSADSRLALVAGGIAMVPDVNIIGRADRVFFSVNGNALRHLPSQWRAVVRTDRIGTQF